MIKPTFDFEWLSETALLLEAQQPADLDLSIYLDQLAKHIRHDAPSFLRQATPSFKHLLIEFDPLTEVEQAEYYVHQQLKYFQPYQHNNQHWRIAVEYSGEDLAEVADRLTLSIKQVIELHTNTVWRVQALGFAPGFAYMADAPQALRLPRRATARIKVPAGSVAIAEQFSAIYPVDSPGGWHIIGYTDQPLFDWQQSPPGLFSVGDSIEFYDKANP